MVLGVEIDMIMIFEKWRSCVLFLIYYMQQYFWYSDTIIFI